MSYDWDHISTMGMELESYAEYEAPSETEEMLKALCLLSCYPDYMSEKLLSVVVEEMEERLSIYKKRTRIETTEETFTRKVTDLIWLEEEE